MSSSGAMLNTIASFVVHSWRGRTPKSRGMSTAWRVTDEFEEYPEWLRNGQQIRQMAIVISRVLSGAFKLAEVASLLGDFLPDLYPLRLNLALPGAGCAGPAARNCLPLTDEFQTPSLTSSPSDLFLRHSLNQPPSTPRQSTISARTKLFSIAIP